MLAKKKRRRRIIGGILAAVALVAGIWVLVDYIDEQRTQRLYQAELDEVMSIGDLERDEEFHAKLDHIRDFINDHSEHRMDKEFWRLHAQGDGIGFLQRIRAHAEGKSDARAPMDCSSRSNLMAKMLREMGYETRMVALFNTKRTAKANSHAVLDVKNPNTGRWETQDPDFDLYWKSTKTGERVSIADESADLDAIVPCGDDHCGWDNTGRDGQQAIKLQKLMDIIGITRREQDIRYGLYTPRADVTAIFKRGSESGTFCEMFAKRCRDGFVEITQHEDLERKIYR